MTTDVAGGVWIYAASLCRALARLDVEVALVVLGEPSPAQREAVRDVPGLELSVRPCPLEWMEKPWSALDAIEGELLRLADEGACDLVHLNHLVHGHLAWKRPVVCAVHSCVPSWFRAVRGESAPATYATYRERVGRSLRAADRVIAPSAWMLAQARARYGPFAVDAVIPNGTDAPAGEPEAEREGVLAAGRIWDEAKNLEPLAALAPRLAEPLEILGPRRPPAADALPLDAGVAQSTLWARMRRAKVFAAPARYEPFGLGVLEAARSGCALVLGDIPTLRSIWQGAALFVDPRRPERWVDVLERLLEERETRLRLAAAARARSAGFTLARMARDHLALYAGMTHRRFSDRGARAAARAPGPDATRNPRAGRGMRP